jgi:hypothetical protein
MAPRAEKLNQLLALLGGAVGEGESFPEFCKAFTVRQNAEDALAFSRVPYEERLLLLPQCLRSTKQCVAEEEAAEYVCGRCGACKIDAILRRAEELGYRRVAVLKGGKAIAQLIETLDPKAVLGVACDFEGVLGILECRRLGVPVQFVPLLRDGCADTDVDLEEVVEMMGFLRPC